ncbi:MAG: TMEM175 family protein [Blastococcus sp.]
MSHTRERPAAGRLHSPGRLEAFGDGVFAIAITLLVLEIAVPAVSGGELLHALGRQWPAYLAYGMSFFSIGVLWIVHYGVTRALRGVDALFLRLNLLFLFFVAFLPYPTRLLAEFLTDKAGERVAVTVYALTLFAISLTLRLLWHYATDGRRLIADDITDEQITADNTTLTPALGFYAVAVGLGLLAPWRRSQCSCWRSSSSPSPVGTSADGYTCGAASGRAELALDHVARREPDVRVVGIRPCNEASSDVALAGAAPPSCRSRRRQSGHGCLLPPASE